MLAKKLQVSVLRLRPWTCRARRNNVVWRLNMPIPQKDMHIWVPQTNKYYYADVDEEKEVPEEAEGELDCFRLADEAFLSDLREKLFEAFPDWKSDPLYDPIASVCFANALYLVQKLEGHHPLYQTLLEEYHSLMRQYQSIWQKYPLVEYSEEVQFFVKFFDPEQMLTFLYDEKDSSLSPAPCTPNDALKFGFTFVFPKGRDLLNVKEDINSFLFDKFREIGQQVPVEWTDEYLILKFQGGPDHDGGRLDEIRFWSDYKYSNVSLFFTSHWSAMCLFPRCILQLILLFASPIPASCTIIN